MKKKVADDGGALGPMRPGGKRGDVVGGEREQKVGIDQLALVADLLVRR
jgi:hypothetical protein